MTPADRIREQTSELRRAHLIHHAQAIEDALDEVERRKRMADAALEAIGERVELLERELAEWRDRAGDHLAVLNVVELERDALRRGLAERDEALRFYADEENYRWSEGEPHKRGVIQSEDRGAVARAVLSSRDPQRKPR